MKFGKNYARLVLVDYAHRFTGLLLILKCFVKIELIMAARNILGIDICLAKQGKNYFCVSKILGCLVFVAGHSRRNSCYPHLQL